jgi:hypothetical protein
VGDDPQVGQTGPNWDAGLKGFFWAKMRKKENGLPNKILNLFKD